MVRNKKHQNNWNALKDNCLSFFKKNKLFLFIISFLLLLIIFSILGIVDQTNKFLIQTCSVGPLSVFTVISLVLIMIGVIWIIATQIVARGGESL